MTTKAVVVTDNRWYELLIEDCKNLVTEGVFQSRWTLLETYHDLGKRILQDKDKAKAKYGDKYCHNVAESLGMREREVYRAVQFAEKFPDLAKLPGGKNISWHKVCNELLADPDGEGQLKEPPEKCECPECGRIHNRKEEE